MSIIQRLRAYHATLGILVVAAYLSGEDDVIHAWIGYAIAVVIVGRLVAALTGLPALGLSRFYPQFEGLRLGTAFTHPAISKALLASIAVCLVAATLTGIAIDGGRSIGVTHPSASISAQADNVRSDRDVEERSGDAEEGEGGPLGEAHEVVSNLLMLLVGLHIAYLLAFKWKLARFMLFWPPPHGGDGRVVTSPPAQAVVPVASVANPRGQDG